MRSVTFRYEDIVALSAALAETRGSLSLPKGERVNDGEWVLAIFEIGSNRRATAAAARGVCAAGDTHLEFERRDWERLSVFVAARSEHMRSARPMASSSKIPVAPKVSSSGSIPAAPEIAPPSTSRRRSGRPAVASPAIPATSRGSTPPPTIKSVPPPARPPVARGFEPELSSPTEAPPPRSRRLDDIPSSTALESTRIPFGSRVLVVDDDAGAGGELRAMLAEMGLIVELASTSENAEERMKAKTFDALVLDLQARKVDSRAFVAKVRADARVADIPVLFISSRPTSRDVVDAFAIGADDFLPKPFRTPELAARIFGLLRRARLARGWMGGNTGGRGDQR